MWGVGTLGYGGKTRQKQYCQKQPKRFIETGHQTKNKYFLTELIDELNGCITDSTYIRSPPLPMWKNT